MPLGHNDEESPALRRENLRSLRTLRMPYEDLLIVAAEYVRYVTSLLGL